MLDQEIKSISAQSNNNLIMIPLGDVLEIIRLYASSSPSPSCADWSSIAAQATKGRFSASDVEYIANEFIPTVHYRPSMGMVVMERSTRNQVSEFHRHKLTVRRLKQGLPLMVEKFKAIFLGHEPMKDDEVTPPYTPLPVVETPEVFHQPDQGIKEEPEDEISIVESQKRAPGRPSNRTMVTVSNFESIAPQDYLRELRARAHSTIQRYEDGEVPLYALKPVNESDAVAAGLTATGRVKRRYETKAIRLAKAAAAVASGDVMESHQPGNVSATPSPSSTPAAGSSFALHSIFQKTAEQFARSRAASSTSSAVDDRLV